MPAVHGVVRWRACDLIMRLHEEFGLSVSDDTVYRALKELGFSHVSARPKAYKQDADAMDAFKKTLPDAWRKSASALAVPATRARTQQPKKHLAVHAAELAVKPCLQILRQHHRSLLLRLEHAHRSAVENHVHRAPRLGSSRSVNLRNGITGGCWRKWCPSRTQQGQAASLLLINSNFPSRVGECRIERAARQLTLLLSWGDIVAERAQFGQVDRVPVGISVKPAVDGLEPIGGRRCFRC
jgi:hypothetical protein